MPRQAAIDIGTNSVRLLVADVLPSSSRSPGRPPRVVPILHRLRITRLGEGLTSGGRIRPAAAARTAQAVETFIALAAAAGAASPVIVGTHALRAARDPDELLERLGRPVGILTGDQEARLGYRGALAGLGPRQTASRLLVVDIGGGSIELTRGRRGRIERSLSIPAGAVVLTERFLGHDPPLDAEIGALEAHLARTLGPGLSGLARPRLRLVGVGGTITTMAAIEQRLSPYDPDRVHGFRLSRRAIERITADLLACPLAERRRLPGLQPERADIIVAGALVFRYLMRTWGARAITVSEADLLWGIVLEAPTAFAVHARAR